VSKPSLCRLRLIHTACPLLNMHNPGPLTQLTLASSGYTVPIEAARLRSRSTGGTPSAAPSCSANTVGTNLGVKRIFMSSQLWQAVLGG
jgi:hypothetical protein